MRPLINGCQVTSHQGIRLNQGLDSIDQIKNELVQCEKILEIVLALKNINKLRPQNVMEQNNNIVYDMAVVVDK